jgi:ribose transport system permease protein
MLSGVQVERREIAAYLCAALLTACAGLIHASQLYGAEPASGAGFELNAIAAAVVGGASLRGGRGTMTGTLIGAFIIGILDKGLNQAHVHFSLQYIIKGAVILASVWLDARRDD